VLASLWSVTGVIATVWLVVGVAVAGRYYPGYSHKTQFCSELGASGSPTERLSPLINNYPLGLLFCLFGGYVAGLDEVSVLLTLSGYLIMLHGLGTWVAGYYPMDSDPYIKTPSRECIIHSWAGFIMLLALLIAPILVALSPTTELISLGFRLGSLLSVVGAIYYLWAMAKAVKSKGNTGWYQRISYGIQLLWLSSFSLMLAVVH
jgi:hypothetical membrane protein